MAIGPSSVVTVSDGTAVGYQSTTDERGTIAFGHDADDVSGYTVTWQQRTDTDADGNIVKNADGTTNDYTKAPTVTENTYTSAAYNRLVKVADGQSAHDVATVGQTVELVAGDHVKVEDDTNSIGQQRKKISIVADGTVKENDTGLVTGGTVATALNSEATARQSADTALTNQIQTLSNQAVTYNADKSAVQLAGTNGTKLTNLQEGALSATSTDAVSGKQLYATNQNITTLQSTVSQKADTSLSNLTDAGKTKVKDIMKEDLDQKADATALNSEATARQSADTALTNQIQTLSDQAVTYNADKSKVQLAGTNGTKLTNLQEADLSATSMDAVSGKQLYATNQNITTLQSTVAQKADTSLSNLTDAGKTAVKDIMKTDLAQKADKANVYTKTEVDRQVSNLNTNLAGKADASLSNLTDAGKAAVKDIMKADLDQKANKTDIYTKAETYNRTEIDSKVNGLTSDLSGKADADLSNLTDAGKTAVKDIMKTDLAQKADKADVYMKTEMYNRTEVDDKVNGLTNDLAEKADTSLSNLTDAGKTEVKDIMKTDLDQKVDKTADNLSSEDVGKWQDKLDTGRIVRGDRGLISGGKVFEALQGVGNYGLVKSDGKVVSIAKDDSAEIIDVSGNQKNRVITGVKTDVRDPSSAANVAYVNENTQQVYQDMNHAYGSLKNDISRAAASSNALAALKPMEFDGDDKLQFGVGYGHYRNANAAAVGAFYQPDENCMVNLGASIGNGNPGVSAGITIKFGPGGSGAPMLSKRQMAKIIQNQSVQLEEQSKEIESLKQENQEMKEQLKAILDKLNK